MKIMFLLSRVPYPLDKGDKLRAYHQIRELSADHEIVLCCLNDQDLNESAVEALRPFCSDIEIVNINRLKIGWNLIKGIFSSKPFQVNYFHHQDAQRQIDQFIEKHLPKHIFCQLIRVTEYVRKYTIIPKTLDYMDALSKGAERRIEKSRWLKPLLKIEADRLKWYEAFVFSQFERKTIISEQDRALINHKGSADIQIVPNGIDTDFFTPIQRKKDYDLVFTGNMNYPPNVEGSVFLVEQILPLVHKELPDVRVLISGVNPHPRIKKLQSKHVTVTGWVEDIRESYARSRVFIAPMQIGTGLQNKLLEAMAMQLPCITSSLANNALQATPNHDVLIGKSAEEFAKHAVALINNPELAKTISVNGHKYATSHFNWKQTSKLIDNSISSCC